MDVASIIVPRCRGTAPAGRTSSRGGSALSLTSHARDARCLLKTKHRSARCLPSNASSRAWGQAAPSKAGMARRLRSRSWSSTVRALSSTGAGATASSSIGPAGLAAGDQIHTEVVGMGDGESPLALSSSHRHALLLNVGVGETDRRRHSGEGKRSIRLLGVREGIRQSGTQCAHRAAGCTHASPIIEGPRAHFASPPDINGGVCVAQI